MISIALRNLFGEKTRFFISAGGVAFSVMLILIILSLFRGWQVKSSQYIREIDTDIWVTQDGASDITSSASVIYPEIGDQIEEIDGVTQVFPFVGRPTQFNLRGTDANAYIVGVDSKNPITAPLKMDSGKKNLDKGEIILDKVLARNRELKIGDIIKIFDKDFKVVGIADGANMFVFQFSFIDQDDAKELLTTNDLSTFFLVRTEEGQVASVQKEINKIDGIEALTKNEFVDRNRKLIDEVFLPIITVLLLISVFVGTTIIGLTIYTATIEKGREFGVIKALGASNMQIYRIIFEQSLISGVFGYFVGLGLTIFLVWLIPQFVPAFVTVVLPEDLLMVFFVSIVMSMVASYTPVRRIVKIDPALVFKS